MADSYTQFLQVRLPATNSYNNTWGSTLNSDTVSLLDTAVAGWTTVGLGSATTYSLPALTGGSSSISRYLGLYVTGTPASAVTITVPATVTGKLYLVNNQTAQPITMTYGGAGTTATVNPNELRLIFCDGTNVISVTAAASSSSSMNNVPYSNWARTSRTAAEIAGNTVVVNNISVPTRFPFATVTEAPTTTVDCNAGNSQILTLTGNRVMAAPVNPADGQVLWLIVQQDGTGGRTLSWNAAFYFENGVPPTLGAAPGAIDVFEMRYNAALAKWLAGHFANLNPGTGTTTGITISSNCVDWNLTAVIGTLGAPQTINITVAPGVVIEASSPLVAAMDLSGVISGSTINLVNQGYILGHGGDGADGAVANYPGSGATVLAAGFATAGGKAINGPGSGVTLNITNASGHIWGGGGGGGGAGATDGGGGGDGLGNGAGGGAGAGNGKRGRGGRGVFIGGGSSPASDGGDGSMSLTASAFGAAGTSTQNGAGAAGTAGAGGDWGTAGAPGTNPATTPVGHTGPFSAGGAAGKAAELNGGTATFVSGSGAPNVKGAVA